MLVVSLHQLKRMFLLQKEDKAFAPRDERTRCASTRDAANVKITVKQTHFIYKYIDIDRHINIDATRKVSCKGRIPSVNVSLRVFLL